MHDFLENLRNRPAHVRNRFALIVSLVVAGIVFFVWFLAQVYGSDWSGNFSLSTVWSRIVSDISSNLAPFFSK